MVFKKKTHAGKKAAMMAIVVILSEFFAYYTYQIIIGAVPTVVEAIWFVVWQALIAGGIVFIVSYLIFQWNN